MGRPDYDDGAKQSGRRLKWLGWAALLLGLPLALMGAITPPNEYRAALGIDALDCDGPFGVYLFAVPALLIYGVGLVINAQAWRRRTNLLLALVCVVLCLALAINLTRAGIVDHAQAAACSSK